MAATPSSLPASVLKDDFPRPQSLRRFDAIQEGRCQNRTRPRGLGLDRLGLRQTADAAKRSNSLPRQHGADHRFVELWPWQHGDAVGCGWRIRKKCSRPPALVTCQYNSSPPRAPGR
jgi:hypothetical protein